jgi:CRISPR-associated protein (TIGR03984 family)
MWGTGVEKVEKEDNWLKLTEERKTDIYVPFKVEENMLPLKYKVINYIGFDDNGIAVFEDARLFGFFDKDENKNENRIKMPKPEII